MAKQLDQSLSKGLTDFFPVTADESDETYDYVGYMDSDGVILIMKATKEGTSIRWYVATGTFDTVWAGRTGYTYVLPSELTKPRV